MNKKYDHANLAMWGTDGRDMGTYEKKIHPDQFWQLKANDNHPGYFYIYNVVHSGYRVAKWGKGNTSVGAFYGNYNDDQLWKFEKVDGKYFIPNF